MLPRPLTTLVLLVTLALACTSNASPAEPSPTAATPPREVAPAPTATAPPTSTPSAESTPTAEPTPEVVWNADGLPVGIEGPLIVLREGGGNVAVVTVAGRRLSLLHFGDERVSVIELPAP